MSNAYIFTYILALPCMNSSVTACQIANTNCMQDEPLAFGLSEQSRLFFYDESSKIFFYDECVYKHIHIKVKKEKGVI